MSQVLFSPIPKISLESLIDFSVNKMALREFVLHLEEWSKLSGGIIKNFNGRTLSDVIKRHFNVLIDFHIEKSPYPNAWIMPPDIDKNNPMVNGWRKFYANSKQGREVASWGKGDNIGSIDLSTGKASGFFTKVLADSAVTTKMLEMLDPEEIAEVMFHEIGHYLIYLAMLGNSVNTVFLLDDLCRRAMNVPNKDARIILVRDFEKNTGVKISNKELINETNSAETIAVAVYSDIVEHQRSEFGSTLYDMRNWESLADNFVVRMGGGKALASALSKIGPLAEPQYFRNNILFYTVEIAKAIGMVALIVIGTLTINLPILLSATIILASSPFEREYDKPQERLTRIRTDLITQIKDPRCPKDRREKIVNDIKYLDGLIEEVNNHYTFFELLWIVVSPWTRRQNSLTKELKEIETLVNNDLFLESARLKGLA